MNERRADAPSMESARQLTREGSFEDALAGLESVVSLLERGRLPIDESIQWYEIGLALSRHCVELLASAELRIGTLEDTFGLLRQDDDRRDLEDLAASETPRRSPKDW